MTAHREGVTMKDSFGKFLVFGTIGLVAGLNAGTAARAEAIVITGQQTSPVILGGGDSLTVRPGGSIELTDQPYPDDYYECCSYSVDVSGTNSSILIDGYIYGQNEWSIYLSSGSVLTGDLTVNGGIGPNPIDGLPESGIAERGIQMDGATIDGRFVNNGIINVRDHTLEMKQGSYIGGGFLNTGSIISQVGGIRIKGTIANGFVNEGLISSLPCSVDADSCYANPKGIEINDGGGINGDFVNSGSIISRGSAVDASRATFNGSIINTGTVISRQTTFKLSGSVTFDDNFNVIESFPTTINGSFVNSGTIQGISNKAVEFSRSIVTGDIVNELGGIINADDQAIRLDNSILNGSLINRGVLSSLGGDHALTIEGSGSRVDGYVINTGTISAAGAGKKGIRITSGAVVSGITNVGTISGSLPDSGDRYDIEQQGSLGTLNNYQGATGSGGRALSYSQYLPTYYNMIAYGDRYGQLSVGDLNASSGTMMFGIFGGDPANGIAASSLKTRVYENVVTGAVQDDFTNVFDESEAVTNTFGLSGAAFGNYNGVAWMLTDATYRGVDDLVWDLTILNFGSDMAEPQRAMLEQRQRAIRVGLDHDCAEFYTNNICVSLQARQSGFGDEVEGAGVLTVAKRIDTSLRFGGFIDARVASNEVDGIEMKTGLPMFGLFAAYSAGEDGAGFQARVSTAFESGIADITRDNLIGSAASVTEEADVQSYGAALRLGLGAELTNNTLVTPYLGLVYSNSSRASYSENYQAGVVDDPFSYSAYGEERMTGTMGVDVEGSISADTYYRFGGGIDHDFSSSLDAFEVSSDLFGDIAYTSDASVRDYRLFGSFGLGYIVEPNRTLTLDINGSQMDDGNDLDYSLMAGYRMAF